MAQCSNETEFGEMGKRKKYSLEYKLLVIEAAEKEGNRPVAKRFDICESMVRSWRKNKSKITDNNELPTAKKFRVSGGGKKVQDIDLEKKLVAEISDRREKKLTTSCKWVIIRAKELHHIKLQNGESASSTFNASNGWLQKFLARHKLTIRSCIFQKLPGEIISKLTDFVISVRKQQIKNNYDFNSIYACGETTVWFDIPPINPPINSGHEQMHVIVMLCAKATGEKCLPFVLLKRSRSFPALEKSFPDLNFAYNASGWMDNENIKKFLSLITTEKSSTRKLIIWDAYCCHICEETKSYVEKLDIDTAVIPNSCTELIHPRDVSWSKLFKAYVTEQYTDWLAAGTSDFMKDGEMKPAFLKVISQWISNAWNSISNELIQKSFRSCGIALNVDGSEDTEITCFQPDQDCSGGRELLAKKQANLSLEIEADDEADLGESLIKFNSDFLEQSIVIGSDEEIVDNEH